MNPDISVVMPVKNGMPYLPKAIDSILGQTFKNLELIVINDGSSDGSLEYLQALTDPRLRLISEKTGNIAASLNLAISVAKSDVIARMDADDISMPDRLEIQLDQLKNGYSLVGSCCNSIDDANNDLPSESRPLSDIAIRWALLFRCGFVHPSTCFSKQTFMRAGPYSETYKVAQDYDLWTRMILYGTVSNSKVPLLVYRKHAANISTKHRVEQNQNSSEIASTYANRINPAISKTAWHSLHRFLVGGAIDNTTQLISLARTYRKMKIFFLTSYRKNIDRETKIAMRSYSERLRWRCVDAIQENRASKIDAAIAALIFDPAIRNPKLIYGKIREYFHGK